MLISKLIEDLQRTLDEEGDMEATMTATFLSEGYRSGGDVPANPGVMADVFESTVEGHRVIDDDHKLGKRVKIHWQM